MGREGKGGPYTDPPPRARRNRVIMDEEDLLDENIPAKSKVIGALNLVEDDDETATKKDSSGVVRSFSNVVRWISDSITGSGKGKHGNVLLDHLRNSTMFRYCTEEQRQRVANAMERIRFRKGDVLMIQGEPQLEAYVIVEGTVVRKRLIEDQLHLMGPLGYAGSKDSIGLLHLLKKEPAYSTVQATSDGYAYILDSEVFHELLEEDPTFSQDVICSLVNELRHQTIVQRTPLFLQTGKNLPTEPLPWFAISCAAAVESFYRSGLNSILIRQLTGGPAAFFPNMQIQTPTRILYINGFKGLRHLFETQIDLSDYPNPQLMGLALALVPGIVMSPISSILEACNVGHKNPEPLVIRWTRGLMPRCLREVIFGVGINQLSDYFEERLDNVFTSTTTRNMAGSLLAGCVAGYLSHIPHNLSTLKLLEPKTSYKTHFKNLAEPWEKGIRNTFPTLRPQVRSTLASIGIVVFPKGCLIRTCQIAGSFIIINSTINALKHIKVNIHMGERKGVVS
uniref:Cyclic nucleotide-binding domain-containing protein n=1 Tax=Aplanochytrium stocchinoi TaxID=215587 RepID=A0A7S3UZ77_9STRA|mmetsp:Transcript_16746/g.21406  ORF Transcript_16746/g.21406 Transcript_16746/m.21406 type:complete len:509 (+) Transcript_16746:205-1731(+)